MSEYIVRETGYPGELKLEVVGELVRCKDCTYWDIPGYCVDFMTQDENGFCKWGKRKETENG